MTQTLQLSKQLIPFHLHQFIPHNLLPSTPFIKMKRLPQIDDSLLIITEYMSLNISFTTPLLQSFEFLEQYHKYNLRSVLSSFPLPLQDFDRYYNEIQNTIMLKYKKNVTKIMKLVYEMLNVTNCQKINEMKMYQKMFQSIKTQLLLKRRQTDVYGFKKKMQQNKNNNKQTVKNLIEWCDNYLNLNNLQAMKDKEKDRKENQNFRSKIKQQIQEITEKIKTQSIQMMNKMNDCKVQQPYIPQNQAYQIIEVPKVLESFYKKMKIKNIQIDQVLQKKHYAIQEQIKKLYQQGLYQYKQQTSAYAKQLIQRYNKECLNMNSWERLKTSIQTSSVSFQKRRQLNANDINKKIDNYKGSETKPAIKNINKQLKFDKVIRFYDIQSGKEQVLQLAQSVLPTGKIKKDGKNQLFQFDLQFDLATNPYQLRGSYKISNIHDNIVKSNRHLCPDKVNTKYEDKVNTKYEDKVNSKYEDKVNTKYEDKVNSKHEDKVNTKYEDKIRKLQKDYFEYLRWQQAINNVQLSKGIFYYNKNIYAKRSSITSSVFQLQMKLQTKNEPSLQHDVRGGSQFCRAFQKKKKSSYQVGQQSARFNTQRQPKHQYFWYKNQLQRRDSIGDYSHLPHLQLRQLQTQNNGYEEHKMIQYERRLQSLDNLIELKSYPKFCSLSINPKTKKGGLDTTTFSEGGRIYRYGIQIFSKWESYTGNNNRHSDDPNNHHSAIRLSPLTLQSLNKFFFYYFKQRYYRQSKLIEENSQIPLLMTLQPEEEFISQKMLRKIILLMRKFDFFILWTLRDLILYHQKTEFRQRRGNMTIYMFGESQKNASGLTWQLNKRLDQSFKQQPQSTSKDSISGSKSQLTYFFSVKLQPLFLTNPQNKQTIKEILCKLQCIHRILYQRHKPPLTLNNLVQKGKQLWQEIISKRMFEGDKTCQQDSKQAGIT